MLRHITKSRIALAMALPSWILLFAAFVTAIATPSPDAPIGVYERKALYFKLYSYSGVILFLASLILATWGFKKDKWVSILTYVVHIVIITVSAL